MKPIVHGLEKEFECRIDVLYFDVSDKTYADVQKKLKFRGTPEFILLQPDGERVRDWTGIVSEAELKAAMEAIVEKKQ